MSDIKSKPTNIHIEIVALAGSDIPGDIIPEMVRLANKLDISVEANLNDVKTVAYPDDDPFHLAVAWRRAFKSTNPHPMAFARDGKEVMERP